MKFINEFVPPRKKEHLIRNIVLTSLLISGYHIWVALFGADELLVAANFIGTALAPFALIAGIIVILWIPTYYLIKLKKIVAWVFGKR